MKLLLWAGALALAVVSFVVPAAAQTTIDLGAAATTWMPILTGIVGAVVFVLAGWVLAIGTKKLGISIDDSMRNSLQTAARNAAGLLLNQLGNQLSGKVIDVKNPLVAQAANYVITHAPDAIDHFGLTPDVIAEKVLALLPQVANTATVTPAAPSA
jgi:hypothetical protein